MVGGKNMRPRPTVYIVLKRVANKEGRIIFEEIIGVYDNLKLANDSRFESVDDCGYRTYTTVQAHVLRSKARAA